MTKKILRVKDAGNCVGVCFFLYAVLFLLFRVSAFVYSAEFSMNFASISDWNCPLLVASNVKIDYDFTDFFTDFRNVHFPHNIKHTAFYLLQYLPVLRQNLN